MKKYSIPFGCLLLLAFAVRAHSQPLTFNTLAGLPAGGSADGSGGSARFNAPCGVAADSSGNVYVADTFNHTIRKITPAGVVSTLAGLAGVSGAVDATGSNARFNQPGGVTVDGSGNVYVGDSGNQTIRKITAGGVVSTWAGSAGVSGSADLTGTSALFNQPQGVAVDTSGNVYVADYGNHTVRKITPLRVVSTLAGSAGISGTNDASGSSARFYQPEGVAVDSAGNVYVADTANSTIRKVTASGVVSTLAGSAGNSGSADGTGSIARFYQPEAVAVDGADNVYVGDYFNHTIRKVTSAGVVSTLAGLAGNYGSIDGTNSAARFWGPEGIAVNTNNLNLFVADTGNGTIRKITPSGATMTVSTFAGSASTGSADGTGNNGRFYWPTAVAVAGAGNVYVADTENGTVRKMTPAGLVSTFAGSAGNYGSNDGSAGVARFFGPQGIGVDGAGNVYVADSANATIRKVSSAGIVSTLAGSPGSPGSLDGTNGGAQFYQPQGVAADGAGNVYVADTWNHTIRKITPAGVVSTVAGLAGNFGSADGTNSKARFYWPAAVALDGAGNLYVADYLSHTIRRIAPTGSIWVVTTLAGMPGAWGKADGTNSNARFYHPQGIAVDSGTNVYVVDSGNHAIRKLTPTGSNWVVSTVAGLPEIPGSANGLGSAARFFSPAGIAVTAGGSFYLADSGNNDIRSAVLITNGAPAIIVQPQSQTVDPATSVTFSVSATGAPTLSYQWRFNGSNISGMTASSYTRINAQVSDIGNYSVVITNSVGSVTSEDAFLTVNGIPFILSQPQGVAVALGQSASFSVLAIGTAPLAYQWRFSGNNIPGATASSFTLDSVAGTNNGPYSVVVTNVFGATTSSDALLAVMALKGWGDDSFGQSDLSIAAANTIAVAAGAWHNLALHADGTVIGWGDNFNGQCTVPAGLADALAIAAGGYHSLAIRANGTVLAWGANDYAQTNVPAGLGKVIAIAGGTWHSLALRSDGTIVAWGDNSRGQTNVPPGLTNVVAIAAGGSHSLALKSDGTVAAWGENANAGGDYSGQSVVPPGLSNVTGIAAGEYHSLAVRADGTVVAWGDNSQGQCNLPVITSAVALAGGGAHSLALNGDGTVIAWGANWNGQCDLPPGLGDVVGICAGEAHSLVLVQSTLPFPRLFSQGRLGNRFGAVIQTLNRKSYALDFNNSLTVSNWNTLSTNAGNGALKMLSDTNAIARQRFYRMRQL